MVLRRTLGGLLIVPTLALPLGACGSSKSSSSSASSASSGRTLSLTISESGGKTQFTAPSTLQGGLVTVTLKNQGKAPHNAQLVLVRGNHTVADVLKQLTGNSAKTPSW